jgi:hypothetical protein
MAKRTPLDEKPFRPLDVTILSSVIKHVPENRGLASASAAVAEAKVIDLVSVPGGIRQGSGREMGEPHVAPVAQRLDQEKRVLYTREETHAIDRLVNNLAVRLNAQVKVSHVLRALTTLLLHAEGQIDKRAGEQGPLARPPNGDFAALQRFERAIACILASAIRDAGLPR